LSLIKHDKEQVRCRISILFDDIGAPQQGFDLQGNKQSVNLAFELILGVAQIIFNFSFELFAFCAKNVLLTYFAVFCRIVVPGLLVKHYKQIDRTKNQ